MQEDNKTYLLIISKLIEFFEENNYQPGDKLPPEDVLASQLYFGRPALREALRILELLGVIETTRGRANIYIKDRNKGLLSFLTIFTNLYADGFDGLTELRANIEVLGVESFIENATDIDIMELEFTARKFLTESDDVMICCTDDSHHIKFHQLLVKYSASDFEKEFLTLSICTQYLTKVLKDVKEKDVDSEKVRGIKAGRTHQEIIDAIKAKDTKKAKEIVRGHVMYYVDLRKLL